MHKNMNILLKETSSIYSASSINSTTSSNIICHKRNNSVSNASVQGKVSSSSSKNTSPLHQQVFRIFL